MKLKLDIDPDIVAMMAAEVAAGERAVTTAMREAGTVIAASPWMRAALRYGVTAFAILLFLLALRRSGERVGRIAERLENTEKANETQRRMLEAAARRPRDRNDLANRLRDGGF